MKRLFIALCLVCIIYPGASIYADSNRLVDTWHLGGVEIKVDAVVDDVSSNEAQIIKAKPWCWNPTEEAISFFSGDTNKKNHPDLTVKDCSDSLFWYDSNLYISAGNDIYMSYGSLRTSNSNSNIDPQYWLDHSIDGLHLQDAIQQSQTFIMMLGLQESDPFHIDVLTTDFYKMQVEQMKSIGFLPNTGYDSILAMNPAYLIFFHVYYNDVPIYPNQINDTNELSITGGFICFAVTKDGLEVIRIFGCPAFPGEIIQTSPKIDIDGAVESFNEALESILFSSDESIFVYKITYNYIPVFSYKNASTAELIPAWTFSYKLLQMDAEETIDEAMHFNAITGEQILY